MPSESLSFAPCNKESVTFYSVSLFDDHVNLKTQETLSLL